MITVVVNTCDLWQSHKSFKLVGVFTNKQKLDIVIRKLLKNEIILLKGKGVHRQTIKDI